MYGWVLIYNIYSIYKTNRITITYGLSISSCGYKTIIVDILYVFPKLADTLVFNNVLKIV